MRTTSFCQTVSAVSVKCFRSAAFGFALFSFVILFLGNSKSFALESRRDAESKNYFDSENFIELEQNHLEAENDIFYSENADFGKVENQNENLVENQIESQGKKQNGKQNGKTQNLGVTEIQENRWERSLTESGFQEIKRSDFEGKGLSAVEVLSSLSGVQMYKQGGLGSFQTISVRGVAAKNILICIDGIPLNDASGGAVDLGTIDLNQMEKIEIYKDHVPAKFGMKGIGSVVNFITDINSESGGRALVSYGSHNASEVSLQIAKNISDSVRFSTSVSMRHSDNDYEFTNRNGTPYNKNDDFTDTRENAEFTDYNMQAAFRILHPAAFFSTVSVGTSYAEGGNPGREDYQTQVAKFNGRSAMFRYFLEVPPLFETLFFTGGVSGRFTETLAESYYPLDHIGYVSSEYLEYGAAEYKVIPEVQAEYSNRFGIKTSARAAFEWERADARGDSKDWGLTRYAISLAADISYQIWKYMAVGVEGGTYGLRDELEAGTFILPTGNKTLKNGSERDVQFSGRVFLQFGAIGSNMNSESFAFSHSESELKSDAQSGKINFGNYMKRNPFGGSISFGRFFKTPELTELYGVFPGGVSNPDLKDEMAFRTEVAAFACVPFGNAVLKAAYFDTRLENGIYWITSAAFRRAENVERALIRGVEAEIQSAPTDFAEFIFRATFQKTKNLSNHLIYKNKMLPGEPRASYFVGTKILLPFHFEFSWESSYRTAIYSDRAEKICQKGTPRHRAILGYKPFEKTRLYFAIDNLSNETYNNIYTPFPTPGREYKFTFIQNF